MDVANDYTIWLLLLFIVIAHWTILDDSIDIYLCYFVVILLIVCDLMVHFSSQNRRLRKSERESNLNQNQNSSPDRPISFSDIEIVIVR